MDRQEILELIMKYHNGTLSAEQARLLADWVKSSPDAAASFKAKIKLLDGAQHAHSDAENFLKTIKRKRTRRSIKRAAFLATNVAVAAIVAILIVLSAQPKTGSEPAIAQASTTVETEDMPNTTSVSAYSRIYRAPHSSKLPVTLEDGTKVVLNQDSQLYISQSFGGKTRTVKLNGEAYFDVAKDATKPFRILCRDEMYIVRGTSFNIMSYDIDRYSVVTLHSGSLEAKVNNGTLMLSPGDQLKVDLDTDSIQRQKVDVSNSTSWMSSNSLHIESLPLRVVASLISRKYGVKVNVHASISNICYDGVIDDETLEVALRLLTITSPIGLKVTESNGEYFIMESTKTRI